MQGQLILGTSMIVVTVIFHAFCLVHLARLLQRIAASLKTIGTKWSNISLLVIAMNVIVVIHTVEAWGWAYLFHFLGEFADWNRALYFSVVTSTTLGYGDVTLSERWQLLGTFEAMGGLILFGASTAFLFAVTQHFLKEDLYGPSAGQ